MQYEWQTPTHISQLQMPTQSVAQYNHAALPTNPSSSFDDHVEHNSAFERVDPHEYSPPFEPFGQKLHETQTYTSADTLFSLDIPSPSKCTLGTLEFVIDLDDSPSQLHRKNPELSPNSRAQIDSWTSCTRTPTPEKPFSFGSTLQAPTTSLCPEMALEAERIQRGNNALQNEMASLLVELNEQQINPEPPVSSSFGDGEYTLPAPKPVLLTRKTATSGGIQKFTWP